MTTENLVSIASHRIWLILPDVMGLLMLGVRNRLMGKEPEKQAAKDVRPKSTGKIAVLPLHGVIEQRSSIWQEIYGGTSTETFGAMFDEVMKDPSIKGVIVDIDSPGGTVPGVQELSDKIYAARGGKPVVGIANSLAASAAMWIGTSFDRLYVTPGGAVGSVGVYSMHQDWSKMMEEAGIKTTIFQTPKFKAEFNPFEPLSDEAKAYEQAEVERIYGDFVSAVARNRNTTPANVRKSYGEGRMVDAKAAVERGMADRVATLEQVISRMAGGRIKVDAPSASDEWDTEPVIEVPADESWKDELATERLRVELRRKGVLNGC